MPGKTSLALKIRNAKARMVGGIKDRCIKGKCCSATCISALKACLVDLSDRVNLLIKKAVFTIRAKTKGVQGVLFKERSTFLRDLEKGLSRTGTKIRFTDSSKSELKIDKKVGGNKVSLLLDRRGTEFSFKVNDSFGRPFGLSTSDGVKLARQAEKLFREVVSHMKPGSVVEVYVYNGDGKGDKRRRAFEGFGFGPINSNNKMFGKVGDDGRFQPASAEDIKVFRASGKFNFSDTGISNELDQYTRLMYVILFGESLPPISTTLNQTGGGGKYS
jgi:hypothetical protein